MIPPELKGLVLNVLNYAMFFGASLVKLPQVIAIARTRSVKGMSEASLAMETLACISFCSYNTMMGHPFKTWGEMAMITLQCLAQLLMYWALATEPLAKAPRALGVSLTLVALSALGSGYLPTALLPVLGVVPTILGAVARVPQIVLNFRQGHTGNQSAITWGLSSAGNCVRIITTLAAVSDIITLGGHAVAATLNLTLLSQIIFYMQSTKEAMQKKDDGKKVK